MTLAPPIDRTQLGTPEQQEAALDLLARWFVDQLVATADDGMQKRS